VSNNIKTISFHRQYLSYTGGHQKVRDYIGHTITESKFKPMIWLNNKSKVRSGLFDEIEGLAYQESYAPSEADIVFLAGMDWDAYRPFFDERQVKLNLIQHVRHADESHPLFKFLNHKAIRICVSDAVREAIEPFANGPCITIKMGHQLPKMKLTKKHDLYILATKQPELGAKIKLWALNEGYTVFMHDHSVERELVHQAMAQSRIALVLPNKTEGFYLPGIEAMGLADWAVVPDCIASREYSVNNANITMCHLSFGGCIEAIQLAFYRVNRWSKWIKQRAGRKISYGYKLDAEGIAYREVLRNLNNYW
jgi:hypothetical protein